MRQLATMFIFTIPHCSRQPARLRRPDTVLTARHGEDLIWLIVRGFPGHPLWLHALWLWLLAVRFRWRGGAGVQSRARRRLARHARRRPIRRLRPRALRGVVVRTTLAITKRGRTHVFMAPLPHWAPTHDTRDTRAREVPSVRCSADATRQVHALGIHSAEHSLHSFLCSFQCCCWCSGQQ